MRRALLSGCLVMLSACTTGRSLLPEADFTQVVLRESPAVVNISGSYAPRPALPDLPPAPRSAPGSCLAT